MPQPRAAGTESSLVAPLERACRTYPGALAVSSKARSVTYEELWEESGRIGSQLQTLGVRSGDIVGVCLRRSVEAVSTMLAVLRCGAAFLPLEPTSPKGYADTALSAAGATTMATDGELARKFESSPFRIADVNAAWDGAFDPPAPDGSDLMYVLFTSGSTGPPKGVAVEQRGVVNLARWHVEEFGLLAGSRTAQGSRLVFDASVWEIWPPLVSGGSIHIVPEAARSFPKALQRWYADHAIEFAFLVSPLAEQFIALPWDEPCPLRVLLTGGERLHCRPPTSFPATLVNAYGPTETTVVATAGIVAPEPADELPSIGRPITGVQVMVLDSEGKECAPGIDGEICIGGDGVARGYINDPRQTARRFVSNPSSSDPSARMYRTGDRGHRDTAGHLHYVGRDDGQLKVRGQRIDPSQLEVSLGQHPRIRSSAVVVVGEALHAGLYAFVVPEWRSPDKFDVTDIKRYLAERFPDYMMPDSFSVVPSLPLTANGKFDRAALAALVEEAPQASIHR